MGRRFHAPVTCNLQSAICNLQPAPGAARAFLSLVVYRIIQQVSTCAVPSDCIFRSSIAAVVDPAAQLWWRDAEDRHSFFFLVEMRSGIPIWLGVMGAAGSPPISLSLAPRLRAAASGPENGGRGEEEEEKGRGPRPGPHLAGPRAHFVMLTNPLTVQGPPAQKAAIYTPPGLAIC